MNNSEVDGVLFYNARRRNSTVSGGDGCTVAGNWPERPPPTHIPLPN